MSIWRHAEANIEELPAWPILAIEKIADINPRIDKSTIPDDLPVSFVPMPAVGAGDGSIRVEETRPAEEVKKGFTPFLEGDVLFAKITPCMENGKMAVVPKLVNGYGFGSTEFHVLRPKPVIDAKYLYYYVSSQSFRGEAERYMTGAVGQKRVSTDYLKRSKIPVAPLGQQKNIVAEIEKQFSRLDEAVASLKRVKANLKRYKAAVLKDAVEGRLVETEAELAAQGRANVAGGTMPGATARQYESGEELLKRILAERRRKWEENELAKMKVQGKAPKDDNWKKKYKEPAAPDTADLPELPEGWSWVAVEQLSLQVQYGYTASAVARESGVRFLRITDIQEDHVDWSTVPSCDISAIEQQELLLQCGDIVFARTGATVGKSFQLKGKFPESVFASYLIRISPHNVQTSDWLNVFFHSSEYWQQIRASQAGIGQPNVNGTKLRGVLVPLPPLAEQHRIVAEVERRLSVIEELEAGVTANVQRATHLRRSVLQRAFVWN